MNRRKFIKASIGAISTVFVAPLVTQLPVPVLPTPHLMYIEDCGIYERNQSEVYNNYKGKWYVDYMEC